MNSLPQPYRGAGIGFSGAALLALTLVAASANAQQVPSLGKATPVQLLPPGGPPPGPPDTSMAQWPSPEELASGKVDSFSGFRGSAAPSCGVAGHPTVRMTFVGQTAQIQIEIARPLERLVGTWPVGENADHRGVRFAALCDRLPPKETVRAPGASCRNAIKGTITVEEVTNTEFRGVLDVTFPHAVFQGGFAVQGPFKAQIPSPPSPHCG